MKRLMFLLPVLALALLAGCVVTPAYRYHGANGGYYYGQPYARSTVVYGGADASWYPYDGYYQGPWVSYHETRVIRHDHDGDRYRDHDHYRGHEHEEGRWHDRGDRGHADRDGRPRFASRFRQTVQQHQDVRPSHPQAQSHSSRQAPARQHRNYKYRDHRSH